MSHNKSDGMLGQLSAFGGFVILGLAIGMVYALRLKGVESTLPGWYSQHLDIWVNAILLLLVSATAFFAAFGSCSIAFFFKYGLNAFLIWLYPAMVVVIVGLFEEPIVPWAKNVPAFFGPTYLGVIALFVVLWGFGIVRENRTSCAPSEQ